jgi:hypothetical protein
MSFDSYHVQTNHDQYETYPLCGNASFDRELVIAETLFKSLHSSNAGDFCWECESIMGLSRG